MTSRRSLPGKRFRRTATAALIGVLSMVVMVPASASAVGVCGTGAGQPGSVVTGLPWAQQWFDPDRLAPLANGYGQTVAVIDTGVDGTHPQLAGQVLPGWDLLRNAPDDNVDCVSRGTAVASIIAAQKVPGVGFRGLAPRARILPIRVTDVDPYNDRDNQGRIHAGTIAAAIIWAVNNHATVIDVSTYVTRSDLELAKAIRYATSSNVVVIAAIGDRDEPRRAGDPPSYPAAYRNVVGVGAVSPDGSATESSDTGQLVKISAPGAGVTAAARVRGHALYDGTQVAAAFVAATAALVRQAYPTLTPAQVAAQIIATADPAAGTPGVVNPYRALTEPMYFAAAPTTTPAAQPALTVPRPDAATVARDRWWQHISVLAVVVASVTLAVLIMVTGGVVAMTRGRSTGWRSSRAPAPPAAVDPQDSAGTDETDLFAVPSIGPPAD